MNQVHRLTRLLLIGLLGLLASTAQAHKASDAYLRVDDRTGLSLQLSLALKDLDAALALDQDTNGELTWGEVRARLDEVLGWIGDGVQVRRTDTHACPARWRFESLERRSDGPYLRASAQPDCGSGATHIDYRLMQGVDPTHRVIVAGQLGGQAVAGVIAPERQPRLALAGLRADTGEAAAVVGSAAPGPATPGRGWQALAQFFSEGVHHLLTGYDHVAFLLALLLPIRLVGAQRAPHALRALVRTVTGFTVGHSITLGLATWGLIEASGAWVEPAIAASIGISAALNLRPLPGLRSDVLALGFGLVHGLGFSGILLESGVAAPLLPWALAGFNLGVECGQLLAVGSWLLAQWALARWWVPHHPRLVRLGSWALIALALFWVGQRLTG